MTAYAKTLTVFLRRRAGASDATLRKIMVDNSRRFPAFEPAIRRRS